MDQEGGGVGRAAGFARRVGRQHFGAALVGGTGFGVRDQALQDLLVFLARKELLPRGRKARRSPPDDGDGRRLDARLRRLPRATFRQRFFDLRQDRAERRDGGVVEPAMLFEPAAGAAGYWRPK